MKPPSRGSPISPHFRSHIQKCVDQHVDEISMNFPPFCCERIPQMGVAPVIIHVRLGFSRFQKPSSFFGGVLFAWLWKPPCFTDKHMVLSYDLTEKWSSYHIISIISIIFQSLSYAFSYHIHDFRLFLSMIFLSLSYCPIIFLSIFLSAQFPAEAPFSALEFLAQGLDALHHEVQHLEAEKWGGGNPKSRHGS